MTARHKKFFPDFSADSLDIRSPRSRDIDDLAPMNTARQTPVMHWRVMILFGVIAVGCLGLVARLFFLQVQTDTAYAQRVDRNRIRREVLPAPRGAILDRFGKQLVQNVPNFVIAIVPADVPAEEEEKKAWLSKVSKIISVSESDMLAEMANKEKSRNEPRVLRERVEYHQALRLTVELSGVAGVSVTAVPTRTYPYKESLSAVLGYIGKITKEELRTNPQASYLDETGKTGLEKTYNTILQGQDGFKDVEHDVLNRATNILRRQDPVPGKTLQTTIDAELQERLSTRLVEAIRSSHSTGGAAVALDPRNGEVLAMVTAPTYDNNWFIDETKKAQRQQAVLDDRKLMLNRAIGGQYPSGSVIKPLISAAALAEGIVTSQTTVLSSGGLRIGQNYFPDWKAGGHGTTNLAKAIAESVNTYYYEIGGGYEQQAGLGVERIVKYLRLFGWGDKLGLDLPGETPGFLPTKEWRETERPDPWRLGDTYHLAIGQGDVEVTPLQLAASLSAVANGGTLFQPHFVKRILTPDGQLDGTEQQPSIIRKDIVDDTYLEAVRVGMRQGVVSGSSRAMQSLPVAVAGKTGTAQFGNQGKTHAWYSVYAPYDNPTIAMIVLVEGGGEGNATALPVARDVLQWYFTRSQQP